MNLHCSDGSGRLSVARIPMLVMWIRQLVVLEQESLWDKIIWITYDAGGLAFEIASLFVGQQL